MPFILGGIFGLIAMYLRRWLEETPVFVEMQAKKHLAEELPLKKVVREHREGVVLSMLLTWLLSAAIVVVILMTPTYLQKLYGFSAVEALHANSLAIVALCMGCVLAGRLADRFGAGPVFVGGGLFLGVSSWVFYHALSNHPGLLVPLYTLTGLSVGLVGAVPFVMFHAFPPVVRFSGISFSYNLAYAIFGGLTPMLVSLWMATTPMAPSYYVASLATLGVLIGCYLLRCRGKSSIASCFG